MKDPLFLGACTALVTPFRNGKLNETMAEALIDRQLEAGIHTVVLGGTTGEAPTLSDEEKLSLFSRSKKYVGEDCLIIAGTGSNNTAHAVTLSREAEETGADALLVVSPYYNKASEEGLIAHFMAIAHSVSIPIILYNVPSRTGVDIPVSVYKRLCAIPNIIGVKEASSDIVKIARIRNACGSNFSVWCGNDDQTVPAISLGAQGVISVLSNVLPKETNAMALAALDGDLDTAAHLQRQLLPLIEALFCEVNPIPVKQAMKLIGFDCGTCRLPLTPAKPDTANRLKDALNIG
jgi:4-hydroxy-tetrahydrodipicolinate synthase